MALPRLLSWSFMHFGKRMGILGNKSRPGRCDAGASDNQRKVRLGGIHHKDKVHHAIAIILGRKWDVVVYGDAIPGAREDPISDMYGEVISKRNQ